MSSHATLPAPTADRAAIPEQWRWNLSDLYPDLDTWRLAKARVDAGVTTLATFTGRLSESAQVLAEALNRRAALERELLRLAVYACSLADEDTRVGAHQALQQEVLLASARLASEASFFDPEILRIDPRRLDEFLASEPALEPFRFPIHNIIRRRAHTLSDAEERLLAGAMPLASTPSEVYSLLTNAEFPFPDIELGDGQRVRVTQSTYVHLRGSANREDRRRAMTAFFGALGQFRSTLGMLFHANAQKQLFFARARRYDTVLDMALDSPNIPRAVYERLVEGVNAHLPSLHRYLALRRRMLDVPVLHYYDLYAPLVASVDQTYSPEEAETFVADAMHPLGDEYVALVHRACRERWVDFFPSEGKRSGAYSEGAAYDVHPFILLNYQGRYDDVSTFAHEVGHAMHSYYSNRAQPFPVASYETFVAEVASTFNEELLLEHSLRTTTDRAVRLSLLGEYLEGIKSTVFRQTQFAEFELRMHEAAREGQALTGDFLARAYLEITRRYYGHGQGVCVVDDEVANEWSYIPHFYRDFYVFQYATSFTASVALADRLASEGPAQQERYLRLISAGGSQPPVELLRAAGVDMTTSEPLDRTIRKMNRVMDEMDQLLQQP